MLVAQLCPILGNPMDCSLPHSSVHGILWARILEWVAIPFSRGFSWHRDRTQVSHIADSSLTEPSGKSQGSWSGLPVPSPRDSFPPRGHTCVSHLCLCWQGGSIPLVLPWSPIVYLMYLYYIFSFTFLSRLWRLSKKSDFLPHFIIFSIC